jgi:hypothetical protein
LAKKLAHRKKAIFATVQRKSDNVCDFPHSLLDWPPAPMGSILQTFGWITKIIANSLYWRENRLFPVSRKKLRFSQKPMLWSKFCIF